MKSLFQALCEFRNLLLHFSPRLLFSLWIKSLLIIFLGCAFGLNCEGDAFLLSFNVRFCVFFFFSYTFRTFIILLLENYRF